MKRSEAKQHHTPQNMNSTRDDFISLLLTFNSIIQGRCDTKRSAFSLNDGAN